jgi:predicted DNA-binding protein (MmcQ/YjbR family)
MGKIFCFIPLDAEEFSIAIKCDPERANELREEYEDINEAFHLNKKHWISLNCTGTLPQKFVFELIDDSYDLVVKGLKKSEKELLLSL